MGRLIVLVVIGLIAVAGFSAYRSSQRPATQAPHGGVTLFSPMTYKQAVESAKGKLLLVDATATWCGPCQMMERDTWPDAALTSWVQDNAVAVQLDVDQDAQSAKDLGITGMPTVILLKDGKELGRLVGYAKPDALLSWLQSKAG
jgi:thioredoxin 1